MNLEKDHGNKEGSPAARDLLYSQILCHINT